MPRIPIVRRMHLLAAEDRLRYLQAGIDQYRAEVDYALDAVRAALREPGRPDAADGRPHGRQPPSYWRGVPEPVESEYFDIVDEDVEDYERSGDQDDFPNGGPAGSDPRRAARPIIGHRQRALLRALDRIVLTPSRSSRGPGLQAVNRQLAIEEEPPADARELAEVFTLWLSAAG